MFSLSDEYARINDDPNERSCDAEGVKQSGELTRPPPTADDFSRPTTRFMIAGREWTRAHRERALDGLRRAAVTWSGIFWLTYWKWRGHHPLTGTAERPGHGVEQQTTIELYGRWLADGSRGTFPKGQAVSTTLARSRYRGHSDNECVLRSGLFMDSDECGGWDEARALCRELGIAFVGQMRPIASDRHHLEIPISPVLIPELDESGVVNWKRNFYQPRLGWVLGIFSELVGLRYEPLWDDAGHASAKHAGYDPCCDQLTHLNHVYTVRPGDPPGHLPVTDWAPGGALDLEVLLGLTEFKAALQMFDHPVRRGGAQRSNRYLPSKATASDAQRKKVPGLEELEEEQETTPMDTRISTVALLVRLRRLSNPDSQKIINLLLDGRSYAPLGQRDNTMWKVACIVAPLAPNEPPEELAKLLFAKSLEAMAKLPDASHANDYVKADLAKAAQKIARAQQRIRTGGRR